MLSKPTKVETYWENLSIPNRYEIIKSNDITFKFGVDTVALPFYALKTQTRIELCHLWSKKLRYEK